MVSLEVFIPSRSRFNRSLTLEFLDNEWPRDKVKLVVPVAQAKQYRPLARKHGIDVLACPHDGIALTRQWIGEQAENKFIMLDDDLRFTHRPTAEPRLYPFERGNMRAMLHLVDIYLDSYVHVAISARQGNNVLPLPAVRCSRPLRALAYRRKAFLACQHGRVAIMEDFDVTMQLLRKGYANAIITSYAQDQGQTQLPGGCSDYRTHKLHEKNVIKFASLHQDFVKLREKNNKTGGAFGKRLEAFIYWEKAYAAGTAIRNPNRTR